VRAGGPGRRFVWGAGLVLLGVVFFLLGWALHDNVVLDGLDKVFSVVGGTSSLVGLLLAVRGQRSAAGGPADASGGHPAPAGLDVLAAAVEQVWRPELRRRRLANPHPLPVAWTTIGPPVADHWSNVRSDGEPTPLELDGCVDVRHPDGLHQVLTDERLRGRVVILGEPGAGKTSLLLREALRLLRARAPEGRVPVLLRLPTWNADEQTLEQWIATQLANEYGHQTPVPVSRLFPLLDGLDEMPASRRARAVRAISDMFDPDHPLVLTSRTTEYLDTLAELSGTTMAAAAVVELTPIPADVVRAYLQRATSRPDDWATTFDHDAAQHSGRLAAALSAPLWVDLARITHTDGDRADGHPARLLDLPDTDTVHAYLLDRLIPAVYSDLPEPGTAGRTWRRAQAHRYLRNLANHMRRRDTQDLAWWEFVHAIPRRTRLAHGIAAGLTYGLAAGLAAGFAAGLTAALAVGLVVGLAAGFATWLTFGPVKPSRRQTRWRRSNRSLIRRIGSGLAFGLMVGRAAGLLIGSIVGLAVGLERGLVVGLAVGLVVGLVAGLAGTLAIGLTYGLVREFTTLFDSGDADVTAVDPPALLHNDRRRALMVGLTIGIMFGLTVGIMFGFDRGPTVGLVVGFVLGPAFGLTFGITRTSWGALQYARLWWCVRGDLPWPIMAFLADAHRRGVLRQAGGVYQFRHGLLRDRLTRGDSEPAEPQRPDVSVGAVSGDGP